jgi:uncharacterized membrane protein YkvA (DUF1232 family)
MTDLTTRCLDTFPTWLAGLDRDVLAALALVDDEALSREARLAVAGTLNYVLLSLDLIPDGLEDLGFLDDACVLRLGAGRASAALGSGDAPPVLARLAGDVALVRELLTKEFDRLDRFVGGLVQRAVRGRTAEAILDDADARAAFRADVEAWAKSFEAPTFARDDKNLVRFASFLDTKLPA